MPFKKINAQENVKKRCEEDAEFAKEYEKLQQKLSGMTDEEEKNFWAGKESR